MARLLEHPNASAFEITALVRSPDKAAKIETLGIRTVIGSYGDLDKLEMLTSEADVVFSIVIELYIYIVIDVSPCRVSRPTVIIWMP